MQHLKHTCLMLLLCIWLSACANRHPVTAKHNNSNPATITVAKLDQNNDGLVDAAEQQLLGSKQADHWPSLLVFSIIGACTLTCCVVCGLVARSRANTEAHGSARHTQADSERLRRSNNNKTI